MAETPDKLLPCPFCGGDAAMPRKVLRDGYENFRDDPDAYAHSVACHACAAEGGWAKSESGARRWWNTRVSPTGTPPQENA